jgi:hypothetical protein
MLEAKAGKYDTRMQEREQFENVAKLAAEIMCKWGMVCAFPDGEDSSGRAKQRLMTEEELVSRAFKSAELFMKYARDNGHIFVCPSLEEDSKTQ